LAYLALSRHLVNVVEHAFVLSCEGYVVRRAEDGGVTCVTPVTARARPERQVSLVVPVDKVVRARLPSAEVGNLVLPVSRLLQSLADQFVHIRDLVLARHLYQSALHTHIER